MAGLFMFTLTQVLVTSITLGALKRSGAIQCAPRPLQVPGMPAVVYCGLLTADSCVTGSMGKPSTTQ